MLVREDVLPAERRVDSDVECFCEGDQSLPRIARSATGDHDGTARGGDPAHDAPDLLWCRCGTGRNRHRGVGVVLDLFAEHVCWQGEHHRSWSARGGDTESSRDELGETVGAVDRCGPLRDRGVEGCEIHLLKSLSSEEIRLYLPEQH